jgi:hypothetical protein
MKLGKRPPGRPKKDYQKDIQKIQHISNLLSSSKPTQPTKKALKFTKALKEYAGKSDTDLLKLSAPIDDTREFGERAEVESPDARLVYIHRALLRNDTPQEIAKALKISVPQVYKFRQQLLSAIRCTVDTLDLPLTIGETLHFYEHCKSTALRYADPDALTSPRLKLEAIRTALSAEKDKTTYMQLIGIYNNNLNQDLSLSFSSLHSKADIIEQAEASPDNIQLLVSHLKEIAQQRQSPSPVTSSSLIPEHTDINPLQYDTSDDMPHPTEDMPALDPLDPGYPGDNEITFEPPPDEI